jgi:hypothetical protein
MSPKKNQFLNDTVADPATVQATTIDWLNAYNAAVQNQVRFFKELFDDTGLSKWIILAGVGGVVELVRLVLDVLWHYR